ncbi:MAG: hypothetical protein CR990_00070 [Desulfococcus sp.]|nr:MAG: hypothetical protein CR990_00070 [Desulfococcus sp.]
MLSLLARILPVREAAIPAPSPGYMLIEKNEDLRRFAEQLARESVIAVDMEADSMYHFRERVCLLQVATPRFNALIDPLCATDIQVLAPVFANPRIQTIFHGADYDIRSLHRDFGIRVENLFDTQIAVRFLGFRETGLEAVLNREFNIQLDKRFQKKDWSQRPLPPEMLQYASRDAIYLIPLTRILEKRLKELKRLDWVREECRNLSEVRYPDTAHEPLFLRFKGAGRFSPRELALLEEILKARMKIARQKDRPPFKIFSNDTVIRIITRRPSTVQQVREAGILSHKQNGMYARHIAEAVQAGLAVAPEELPRYPHKKSRRTAPQVPDRVNALKKWRNEEADRLSIDPALICNKTLITAIARRNPGSASELTAIEELRGWQAEIFGDSILRILEDLPPSGPAPKKRRRRRPGGNSRPHPGPSPG